MQHAEYMREYTAKNSRRINAQRSARRANSTPERLGELREQSRLRNQRYYAVNKDSINSRAADRCWYYTPEKGAGKRAKYGTKYGPVVAVSSARNRAKNLGLPFDLSVEWYEKEFIHGCAVTGLPLDANGAKTPWVAHVDRVVPSLGYVTSNCRLVCAVFNPAKKHWRDEDVLRMASALVSRRTSDA